AERMRAVDLCASGAVAEGDSLMRSAVGLAPLDSTDVLRPRLRTTLGSCLTRARRWQEAETTLLEAEARLRALAGGSPTEPHTTAVTTLVGLYEQWGNA